MLSVSASVIIPSISEDGASHWPWEAGDTIVVTAAEDNRTSLVNQLIKEALWRSQLQVKGWMAVV